MPDELILHRYWRFRQRFVITKSFDMQLINNRIRPRNIRYIDPLPQSKSSISIFALGATAALSRQSLNSNQARFSALLKSGFPLQP